MSLPASEAGAEVSLALAGVAADSLSQMLPGILASGQAQSLLNSQRDRLREQIEGDLDNTLLYIYRELSDAELEQYLDFARSAAGQAYYQAALQAVREGLAVGRELTEPSGPQAARPTAPVRFPSLSAVGAAMKAASIARRPVSMAMARPPCVCITTGFGNSPFAIASATGPETYDVTMRVTTPDSM